jgi:hypothetical protein
MERSASGVEARGSWVEASGSELETRVCSVKAGASCVEIRVSEVETRFSVLEASASGVEISVSEAESGAVRRKADSGAAGAQCWHSDTSAFRQIVAKMLEKLRRGR